MQCRVIPNWETIKLFKQPLTEGEEYLLKFLDSSLPRDNAFTESGELKNYNGWLIFAQPYLNGCRPDIILFHPKIGIQIIEVKDWRLENYYCTEVGNGKWDFFVRKVTGPHRIKSPLKQVEHYKEKITDQLIPFLGELIDSDKKNYGLIKTSIYFHNASTEELFEFFKDQRIPYASFPVFGRNSLKQSLLKQIVPGCHLPRSYFWDASWNTQVLFWLKPPFHSLEQTVALHLNKNQRAFAEPKQEHVRVRGVAGSGKTQVLAYRAGKLASEGYRVLILTFNITLWHYIRDMVQRSPFEFEWERLTFNHFHGFCKDILNQFGEKWPSNDGVEDVFKTTVPNKVLQVISGQEFEKYDAILIDEGQDYFIEWYSMLCSFLSDRDEVVVVCDKKQNIYGREMEWLDKRRAGVEKFGNWIELKTIVRLPEKIAELTKEFSEEFDLNQDVRVEKIERPDLFNQFQEHSIWWNIEPNTWIDKLDEAFDLVKKNSPDIHPSDIVVLLPNKEFGIRYAEHFVKEKKIEVNHVFENQTEERYHRRKKAFWMGDSRIKMSTIHSFKGWESLNVILLIPQYSIEEFEIYNRILYTAMTRTRQNLIILNSNERYKAFGMKFNSVWS